MGYFVVTGTKTSIRMIGKSASQTAKAAKNRAEKYSKKHPDKPVMVVTLRRVKVLKKPA